MQRRLPERLSFLDRMIIFSSCCPLFVQDSDLSGACDIVVAGLVRGSQQHRLLENIEGRDVFRIFAVSLCLTSSDECHEAFSSFCKELLYKWVSLAPVDVTFATLYKGPFYEELCTFFFALCTGLIPEEVQSLDS